MRWADGSWHGEQIVADGQPVTTVLGSPSLVQGAYGQPGNFEVIAPLTDGLAHFWRDNSGSSYPWHGPIWVNKRDPGGDLGDGQFRLPAQTVAATLIQSNYGNLGNLEGLGVWRTTISRTGSLHHMVRGTSGPWAESVIQADGQPVANVVSPDELTSAAPRQMGWFWCRTCQGLFFLSGDSTGVCPAGGAHDHTGSGIYALVHDIQLDAGQNGWRWCHKCSGLFFNGAGSTGVCPAGGAHDRQPSSDYRLGGSARESSGQNGWRWCHKCQGLFFSGAGSMGTCPASGQHDGTGSGDYRLTGW